MDDEEITYVTLDAKTHDRWSLLVIGAHWLHGVTRVTANTTAVLMATAMEHAAQKDYDKRFKEIVR